MNTALHERSQPSDQLPAHRGGERVTGSTYLAQGEGAVIREDTIPLRINGEAARNSNPILEDRALLFVVDSGGRHSFGFFVSTPSQEHTTTGSQEDDEVVVVPFDKASGLFDGETSYEFPEDGLSVGQSNSLLVGEYPGHVQISRQEGSFHVSNGGRSPNVLVAATEARISVDPDHWAFE